MTYMSLIYYICTIISKTSNMEEKKCPECGKEVGEVNTCPECGCPLNVNSSDASTNNEEESLLIECKACKKMISRDATNCPNCGHQTEVGAKNEYDDNQANMIIGIIAAIISIVFFLYFYFIVK